MKTTICALIVSATLLAGVVLTGCSANSPLDIGDYLSNDLPAQNAEIENDRMIIGAYNAEIDPSAGTFTIEPVKRESAFHFPLTNVYPNVLVIDGIGTYPSFWADIELNHPFPGSGIDAYDPRVIAVLPALPGVSSEYSTFDVLTNNAVLKRNDGFTKLFDNPSIPGNTNPFVAYFKNEPYRVWSSTGKTSETRRWYINLDGFGGPMVFQLIVDISTNYPDPSLPLIDNAIEPVDIFVDIEPGLGVNTDPKNITAAIYSWNGVDQVLAECPDLFTGTIPLGSAGAGPAGSHCYTGTVQNLNLAPVGDYKMMVAAKAADADIFLYDECKVHVGGEPLSPIVVKNTGGINSSTILHIDVDEDYAFFGNGSTLYVADVSVPEESRNVKSLTAQSYFLKAHNGYLYFADGAKVSIYDTDPVQFLHLEKVVELPSGIDSLDIEGHYLYATGADTHILDIRDLDSAYVVTTLDNLGDDISVQDGYMYVSNGARLDIIDADPPESAVLVQSIETMCPISGVDTQDDLCVVSEKFSYPDPSYGIDVISIAYPETASIIGSYSTTSWDQNIVISGDYAYSPDFYSVNVFSLENPGVPVLISSVTTPEKCVDLCVRDNYAYVACREHGVSIVKLW